MMCSICAPYKCSCNEPTERQLLSRKIKKLQRNGVLPLGRSIVAKDCSMVTIINPSLETRQIKIG